MKKHGTITYTLSEEEYQQLHFSLLNLEEAIEEEDKKQAIHCISRMREILSPEN